jgi:hypothetical protein
MMADIPTAALAFDAFSHLFPDIHSDFRSKPTFVEVTEASPSRQLTFVQMDDIQQNRHAPN